jgi:hypothetical protein
MCEWSLESNAPRLRLIAFPKNAWKRSADPIYAGDAAKGLIAGNFGGKIERIRHFINGMK